MLGAFLKSIFNGEQIDEKFLIRNKMSIYDFFQGEIIIAEDERVEYIDFLVQGSVFISKFSKSGERIIANSLKAPQIFMLLEFLGGMDNTIGTITSLTNIKIIRIPLPLFKKELKYDIELLNLTLNYVSNFAVELMSQQIIKKSHSIEYNILNYFYNIVLENKLPCKIEFNKSFLADLFNINVRTVYRYLNEWEEKNFIKRQGQNIIINKPGFTKIEKFLDL
ncbi:Crp/Fnr family transcriptional regulator [Peptoniphilus sp. oral taxon 386]|uniref:Crp/Fnr family transcriptional regulator n=1 Tax=Peptoniphilus sp. oral taxon 386 TaxID=652713 RepID=UPI0001DA9AB5|nr:Crp/Fnr family transcriptional regulator [Peptoniphilus sp. oral taxon 386]EFI41999.1 cyclic nucleotide-binding domain protein [Peptoniphilus sp. oral taxon 386 str. F0131]